MAPIATSQLMDMKKRCPRNVLLQGLAIVLKLLSNVIENPGIAKYRSFKLENKTIKEKVLSIPGMQQFLVDLGFVESYGSLTLDERVLMNDLRVNRGVIQTTHDALLESSTSQQDISHVPIDVPGRRPRFHGGYSGSPKVSIEKSSHPFLSNIDQMLHQVLSYEDTALQDFGRSLIPVEKLRQQTLERMRMQQKSLLSTRGQDPVYEDLFLVVFTEWFSRTFFSWVNKVTCKVCASQVGGRSSGYVENGVRVEEIFCCGQPSKFYRYNDIATLLVTRQGRCGEYANCFTFLCRCLGYDARYIFATFDHVWTEVYSPFQGRWLHIDPSDAVIDSPLMYQHGWKRSIDYVLAFSRYDVCDVTWRYFNGDRQALQKQRSRCPERLLEAKLLIIYKELQRELSKPKQVYLFKRMLLDSIQMVGRREPTEDERKGRSSGDLVWRTIRGEESGDAFYVFHLTEEEAESKQFNLRYSAARDSYETFQKDAKGIERILLTTKGWNSCAFSSRNIFRKEEHDWKMVYLARTEQADEAVVEWKVDVSAWKLSIKTVGFRCETKVYENAKIAWEFVTNTGEVVKDIEKIKNCSSVLIRAKLTGGKGDNAWQHSQLFRQKMGSTEYPFELSLMFN